MSTQYSAVLCNVYIKTVYINKHTVLNISYNDSIHTNFAVIRRAIQLDRRAEYGTSVYFKILISNKANIEWQRECKRSECKKTAPNQRRSEYKV